MAKNQFRNWSIQTDPGQPYAKRLSVAIYAKEKAVLSTISLLLCLFAMLGATVRTASAEAFQTISPLVFTKAYQGANPLPQVFTVATADTSFSFSASVINGTGGNWLTLNLGTGNYNTPTTIKATVAPDVTLAAGTYTAQIALKSYDGTITQAIPVSLIIKPTSAAFFDALPGALTFSTVTKSTVIVSQPLPIRNGGTGALSFTAAATTYNKGGWITLSATSGTAPSVLTVGINVSKLPGQGLTVGTFTGQVVVQTSGDSVTIPVSVTVDDTAFRQVNALSFSKVYEEANPLPQVFTVASTGAAFSFNAVAINGTGGNWLSINLGTGNYNTPTVINATVNPDITLAAGTYTAEIVVRSYYGDEAMVIPVSMTVAATNTSSFDALPGELTFSMLTKGSAPPPQAVPIRNAEDGTLNFTASSTTADGSGWITLSATSGTSPYMLKVGIDPSKLPGQSLTAGTFTGQVLLQTSGSTVTIPVSVTVGDSVFRQVNALSFSKVYQGANPLKQVFTVASTGTSFSFNAVAVSGTGGNWLSLNVGSGNYSTPTTINATVNPDITLAAGTYTAQIIVRSYYGDQSMVIPVSLTVAPASASSFDLLPGELTFSMVTKGIAPPQQTVPIRNAGGGTLSFTAASSTADGSNWITLSATSGTAPYLLNIGVDPTKLPGQGLTAGTFTGQVVLQAGGNTVTIPVTFEVGDPVFRQVNPLNFTKLYQGANPLPEVFTVASTGTNFSFNAAAVNGTGGNWLTLNLGTGNYSTPTVINAVVNPDITLAAGTYTAEILIRSYYGDESMVVPVTLTVQPTTASSFDALPSALTFSGQATGAALTSQPLPIRDAGPGTLNWVAKTSTADGGKWLTISTTSGVAPSTPTVSISVANLPGKGLTAGTFTGQVVLQSATGIVTVPVTVTLADSVFVQVPALNFSKPYQGANPATQPITISSTNSALTFSTAALNGTGGNWLSINLGAGNYHTPTNITVTANPNVNLAAGVYTSEILVRSYGGDEAVVIPVTLTITSSTATATPKFNPPGGNFSTGQLITITDATIDSAIYYTTDGTTPTTASPRYSAPLQVNTTQTLKAIAIAPGYPQSAVATATYTITAPVAATPTAIISISEATSGVTVYYTTNGTTPTTASAKYTGPLTVAAGTTLKFIAIGTGYSSSTVRTITVQ